MFLGLWPSPPSSKPAAEHLLASLSDSEPQPPSLASKRNHFHL